MQDPHKLDFKVRKLSLLEGKDLTFSKLLERWNYHRSTKKMKKCPRNIKLQKWIPLSILNVVLASRAKSICTI